MNKDINSGLHLKGKFVLKVLDAITREVIDEQVYDNLVVNGGKLNAAKILGGDSAGEVISKIGVGTNGTAASVTDTTLTGSFVKNLSAGTTYGTNSVTFNYDILTSEANGITIREFGLLNASNVLIARRVLSNPIVKTSSFALQGEWTLTIL